MENNKSIETKDNSVMWPSHALVTVITVVILIVLLALQPWGESPLTEVTSFRMSTSASYVEGDMAASATYQEMAYIYPARSHIVVNPEAGNQEIIIIGDDFYTNNAQYLAAANAGMSVLMSVAANIPSEEHTRITLERLTDIKELAIERIEGATCRHFQGRVDVEKSIEEQIASLDPEQANYDMLVEALREQIEMMRDVKTVVDVWVGRDDGFIRQMRYEAQVGSEHSEASAISSQLIQYYDINKSIVIEPPLDNNGALLPGWYHESF
jgi:hypothetical protein